MNPATRINLNFGILILHVSCQVLLFATAFLIREYKSSGISAAIPVKSINKNRLSTTDHIALYNTMRLTMWLENPENLIPSYTILFTRGTPWQSRRIAPIWDEVRPFLQTHQSGIKHDPFLQTHECSAKPEDN